MGKYYHSLGIVGDREASAVLSQVRLIDAKRLVKKIETLEEGVYSKLKEAMKHALFT
jgi:mRNA-degrading endonuclease toxin of MazEF toxin-antitoxin module